MDTTGITVLVEGKEPVLFDPKSDLTVLKAVKQIRVKFRLVGGSITANGFECDPSQPLRTYQGEDLLFAGFESASEGKSTILVVVVVVIGSVETFFYLSLSAILAHITSKVERDRLGVGTVGVRCPPRSGTGGGLPVYGARISRCSWLAQMPTTTQTICISQFKYCGPGSSSRW
jgi:hypothetical protein